MIGCILKYNRATHVHLYLLLSIVVVQNSHFIDNFSTGETAGLSIIQSALLISDCIF